MKKNQFDLVAPFYSTLVSIAFGKSLLKAQLTFLDEIEEESSVLVIGGGNGAILSHSSFNRAFSIDYLELSSKMIELAQSKGRHLENISFINQDFFEHQGKYDLIICNFFLDCFNKADLLRAIKRLDLLMNSGAKLIVTDFQDTGRKRHKWLVSLMVGFFQITVNLQADKLLDIQNELRQGFEKIKSESYKNDLIFSTIYKIDE